MHSYIALRSFEAKAPTGLKVVKRGEAICLSSAKAANLVKDGLIIEKHVGMNLVGLYDARARTLMDVLGYSLEESRTEASALVASCLKRHESTKTVSTSTEEFLAEVEVFNQKATGNNPIGKETSGKGVGEWAGYRCNIGTGCSHGCLYCYAEKMALRYNRIENSSAWKEENLRYVSTMGCKRYDSQIMFPTSHDITPAYLSAYRCHLHNLLAAGNKVIVVTKPHRESIEAIVSQISMYRDQINFRFTMGGLDGDVMRHWEPGAPPIEERIECLKYAFEKGFETSISAEPMHGGKDEAVKLYYLLEPYITQEIWFGKMNNIGGLRSSNEVKVAKKATELLALQSDKEMLALVDLLRGKQKVRWKDSIKAIMAKDKGEKK